MAYDLFFNKVRIELNETLYKLYYDDLLNMKYDDFHNEIISYGNKTDGDNNIQLLNETIEYYSNNENYEKCAELVKLKNKFNIK